MEKVLTVPQDYVNWLDSIYNMLHYFKNIYQSSIENSHIYGPTISFIPIFVKWTMA